MIDDHSRKILSIVQRDSTVSLAELSRRVGLSQSPIWQRLKSMRDAGIVKGSVTLVDREKVGMTVSVICFIKLNSHKSRDIDDFVERACLIDEVIQCYSIAGEFDFLMHVLAQDIRGYDAIVKPKILGLPWIGSLNSNFVLSVFKETTMVPL